MTDDVLRVERSDGLAIVTLNRPAKMNALSLELRRALTTTFAALEADPSTRVVILTGAGRAFCAGLDLEELGRGASQLGRGQAWADPVAAMTAFSGPIIGAINGVAVTGGLEIALACDFLLAAPAARFADTHVRVGLSPGWGLSQRLPRVIGLGRAKELSLTGNFIDATTAERWGLVNRVVEADALLPACVALATTMLSVDPAFLDHYKRVLDTGYGMTLPAALAFETQAAQDWNDRVPAAALESRRADVMARGQAQSGDSSA